MPTLELREEKAGGGGVPAQSLALVISGGSPPCVSGLANVVHRLPPLRKTVEQVPVFLGSLMSPDEIHPEWTRHGAWEARKGQQRSLLLGAAADASANITTLGALSPASEPWVQFPPALDNLTST